MSLPEFFKFRSGSFEYLCEMTYPQLQRGTLIAKRCMEPNPHPWTKLKSVYQTRRHAQKYSDRMDTVSRAEVTALMLKGLPKWSPLFERWYRNK
jgi:hypothetical protein